MVTGISNVECQGNLLGSGQCHEKAEGGSWKTERPPNRRFFHLPPSNFRLLIEPRKHLRPEAPVMMKPTLSKYLFVFTLLLGFLCVAKTAFGQPRFKDVTEEAGINHIFEVFQGTFGGGAAVIDYNRDGWEDVFIAGGQGKDQLLENQGDGTFRDVSREVGLDALDGFVSQGAAVADVNKDGWPDLFVTTIAFVFGDGFAEAPNVLLINKEGTFVDESLGYRIVEKTFSTSASFGDVNKDGYPDLYVCNYFENYEGNLDEFYGPQPAGDTRPGKDLFYINNKGENFIESTDAFGIIGSGLTFQALWSDFDNDRDLDLLVANDFGNRGFPNFLYRNEYPSNQFTEIGAEKDFDYGINAMGIGACDINGDGFLDYKITNIRSSPFFINQGPELPFSEESEERGTSFLTVRANGGFQVPPYSWGVNFFDVDHDMDSDLYITNGTLNPVLSPNPNLMLVNEDGKFTDYGFYSRSNDHSLGRGSVVFDYDNDGDLDILVVNQSPYRNEEVDFNLDGTRLFRNENDNANNWLKVKLEGRQSETSGIGSRVEAYVGDKMLVKEIYGGSSHESQNTTIAHFGLADNQQVDSLLIKWSSGNEQVVLDVQANQTLEVLEEIQEDQPPSSNEKILLFPNAFSNEVTISYQLPGANLVGLLLYDAQGRFVKRLFVREEGGIGSFTWEVPENLPRGIYFFNLRTEEDTYTIKAVKN